MGLHIASSRFRAHAFRLIACGITLPLLAVAAQAQVVIGGDSRPANANRGYNLSVQTDPNGSVTVDWSVLDSLGNDARRGNGSRAPAAPLVLSAPKPQPQVRQRTATVSSRPAAPAPRAPRAAEDAPPAPGAQAAAPAAPGASASRPGSPIPDLPPPPAAPPAPPAVTPIPSDSAGQPVSQAPARTPVPPEPPQLAPPPAPAPPAIAPAPTRDSAPTPLQAAPQAQPQPPAPPQAVAALPPPSAPVAPPAPAVGATALSIAFRSDSSALPDDAKSRLDGIVRQMTGNDRMRAQIIAYAAGTNDTASQARRLSLSRALAVRSYLIEKGIASTRLDVRALGHQVESGSPDRVDIALASR